MLPALICAEQGPGGQGHPCPPCLLPPLMVFNLNIHRIFDHASFLILEAEWDLGLRVFCSCWGPRVPRHTAGVEPEAPRRQPLHGSGTPGQPLTVHLHADRIHFHRTFREINQALSLGGLAEVLAFAHLHGAHLSERRGSSLIRAQFRFLSCNFMEHYVRNS